MGHHQILLLLIAAAYASGQTTTSTTSDGSKTCTITNKGFPSFSLVFDTSGSMSSYLYSLQDIGRILASRLDSSSANVTRQYTVMEYNDPSVGPLHVTCTATDFFNELYTLSARGGGDCAEYAMAGLLQALKSTPDGSVLMLVSDASAKDSNDTDTVNQIFSLIDSMNVRVFFFVGSCDGTSGYDYQVYRDIATRSYGHVFPVSYTNSRAADLLNFFLKVPINSTTRLFSMDTDNYYYYYYYSGSFSVPSNLTSLIVSVSAASGSIYSLYFYNPSGVRENLPVFVSEYWGKIYYLERPKSGMWTFQIDAYGIYSIRIEGYKGVTSNTSSICSLCDSNAICKKDVLDYTCVCKDGFTGNGLACYDINECDSYTGQSPCGSYSYCVNTYGSYDCPCYSGYTMKNKTCVDIDECASPGLNNCDPKAICYNYYGSYSCYCPSGYYGDGRKCEIDECTKEVCGFGRECIKYTGSHNCSDPCLSYTTLNEPTRSTSYYYNYYYYYYGRSDYYLKGWYRFTGSGGTQLADFCPSIGSCYTTYPMWLQGTHPAPADGIVDRTVCTNYYYGSCCYWTSSIKIKACPGGFYVYKFSYTPSYYTGYCTDPSTVSDSCSCAADEECRKVNGRYGCYCKNNGDSTKVKDLVPTLSCGTQEIKASLKKCDLEKFSLNPKTVHLIDSDCKGFNDFNTTNIITVATVLKNGVCGNQLVSNSTHVTFKNTMYISMDSSVGGEDSVAIDIFCVYPLDLQLSLETTLKPFSNSTSVAVGGTGKLDVTMALYKDSTYKSPYEGSQVLLTAKTNLYIGVMLKIGETSQFSVQITNCYAATSANSTTKYDIIKNSCPTKQDSTINVIQNGGSTNAQFSIQLFGYVTDLNPVYLYCGIHICNKTCTPTCTRARALTDSDSVTTDASLSLGPIYRQDDAPVPVAGGANMVASLTTLLVFLIGSLLI